MFGPWFREQRKRAGLTQMQVAQLSGLHKITISKIEHGQPVTAETAADLARAVGTSVEEAVLRACKVDLPSLRPESEVRFAREIEPILMRAGKMRPQVEQMLKRQAEELVSLVNGNAA